MSDKQYVIDLIKWSSERGREEQMDKLSIPVAEVASFIMALVDKVTGLSISDIVVADDSAYSTYCVMLLTLAQLGYAVGKGEEIPSPPEWLEFENELAKAMVEAIGDGIKS